MTDPQCLLILAEADRQGGMGNVMTALGWDAAAFDDAFMIANEMQNQNLVKLLYSNINKNTIVVELTLVGKEKLRHQ